MEACLLSGWRLTLRAHLRRLYSILHLAPFPQPKVLLVTLTNNFSVFSSKRGRSIGLVS
jgi:hypothetical protein